MGAIRDEPTTSHTAIVNDDVKGCCIAGSGPAGAMLALLLARRGVPVTLLEMHHDFDRAFRGDTVHPSTLEILDQIGLAAPCHQPDALDADVSGRVAVVRAGSRDTAVRPVVFELLVRGPSAE